MKIRNVYSRLLIIVIWSALTLSAPAQQADTQPPPKGGQPGDQGLDGPRPGVGGDFGPAGFGPGGFGGPGGPGMQQEIKLVKQFDKNGDGWLNLEERKAAREYLKTQQSNRGPGGRRGGRPGFGPPGRETEIGSASCRERG